MTHARTDHPSDIPLVSLVIFEHEEDVALGAVASCQCLDVEAALELLTTHATALRDHARAHPGDVEAAEVHS